MGHTCDACGKDFSTKSNLTRHKETTCGKPHKSSNAYKRLLNVENISASTVNLSKTKIINIDKSNTVNTNTINNVTNIAQQNIIVLNNFSKEDIDYISDKFKMKCLKTIDGEGFENMTEKIYFNENHPENQTVKLPNKKEPYVKIYKNGKWELKRKNEIFDTMISNIGNIVDEVLDEVIADMNKNWIKNERRIKQIDKYVKDLFDENSKIRNILREKLTLLFLSNR